MKIKFPFTVLHANKTTDNAVSDWFDELDAVLVSPFVEILGRNVQITYIELVNLTQNMTFKLPFSNRFGTSQSNSDPTQALLFELLPVSKNTSLRYYLRAPGANYCRSPLSPELEEKVHTVESIFIRALTMFSSTIALIYERRDSSVPRRILSSTLKSVVKTRPSRKAQPAALKPKAKPKAKKASKALVLR